MPRKRTRRREISLELDPYFPQAQREIGIAFLLKSQYPEPSERRWPRENFPRTTSPGRMLRTLRMWYQSRAIRARPSAF